MSTLLSISGQGRDYAQQHQIAAFFVIRADKRFIIRSNPDLRAVKSQCAHGAKMIDCDEAEQTKVAFNATKG